MAYTGVEAVSLVRQHLNTVAVDGNWQNSDLLADLNIGLKKVGRVVPSDLLGPLAKYVAISVTHVASPAVPTGSFPAGVFRFVQVSLGQKEVKKVSLNQLFRYYENSASRPYAPASASDESHYYAVHDSFYFFPRYADDQNYTLRYVKEPNALTLVNSMDCHNALGDTVVLLATRLALQQDGRLDAAGLIQTQLNNEINFLAKKFDVDTQDFALSMVPGQPAPVGTG